jgi:hypothetical protein
MYPTSGTTLRADINAVVEEAASADKFFIGDRVLPQSPVDAKSGQYPKVQIAAGELMSSGATDRAPSGSYGEVTRAWTYDTYDCQDRGLEEPVDDCERKDLARFFNVSAAKSKWLLRNMKTAQEIRVAAAVMSATPWGAGTNSVVAYTYANRATIDFPTDIIAAIERVNDNGGQANTIVLSSTLLARLVGTTLLQNFLRGKASTDTQMPVNASTIAAAFADFGIQSCLIGRSRYNAAKKGQTKSMSSIWGTTYVWVGEVQSGPPQNGGAGRILVWNEEGGLYVSESYRDEKRRSDMLRVRQNTIEKIIDGTAGTLITTQYA